MSFAGMAGSPPLNLAHFGRVFDRFFCLPVSFASLFMAKGRCFAWSFVTKCCPTDRTFPHRLVQARCVEQRACDVRRLHRSRSLRIRRRRDRPPNRHIPAQISLTQQNFYAALKIFNVHQPIIVRPSKHKERERNDAACPSSHLCQTPAVILKLALARWLSLARPALPPMIGGAQNVAHRSTTAAVKCSTFPKTRQRERKLALPQMLRGRHKQHDQSQRQKPCRHAFIQGSLSVSEDL